MRSVNGVVIGLVVDVNDPEALGRIRVSFPWMAESEPRSTWARIAAPMSGPERGFFFLPEVDDEVLVAFEHGDLRFPYVLGSLWNGRQQPPHAEPSRRTIETVSGHVLEFEDAGGGERISLRFRGDTPSITLEAERITIAFGAGTSIELDAQGVKLIGPRIELN